MVEFADENIVKEYITAKIDNQLFGFDISEILDVFVPQSITRVPLARPEISGVLNLRGRIVTVIDMYCLLDIKRNVQRTNKIAVGISHKSALYGLLIDEIGEVVKLKKSDIESIPDTLDEKWRSVSSSVVQLSGNLLVILNIAKIFDIIMVQNAA